MRHAKIGDTKLHLREEDDGTSILTINASYLLYLDPTGTDFIKYYMAYSEKPPLVGSVEDNTILHIMMKYKVSRAQAKKDYERLQAIIWGVAMDNACPFSCYDVKMKEPECRLLKAPLRMDLALTYRCNNNCGHCYAGGPRETKELSTEEWKKIIKKCVDFEVPNIVFTGGEALLRGDLEELIRYAESLGAITGLITNGRLLTIERVDSLNKAGLDYVQVTIESPYPEVHDSMCGASAFNEAVAGIKNIVTKVYTTTNTTITQKNRHTIIELIPFIYSLGIRKFGVNAVIRAKRGVETEGVPLDELKELLQQIISKAESLGMEFIWYTPTRYHQINPVEMGLGIKSCSAARLTLAVEPDGGVLPCQSYFEPMGNALTDDLRTIWECDLAKKLREHGFASDKCKSCELFPLCGGGCPLELCCGH
jgi:radical SAM protein with 4Fe4S-binding SPASM domain